MIVQRLRSLLRNHWGPLGTAVAISCIYFVLDLRGGDLAAHLYRAELFKHDGFFVWNYNWYGGHYVVSYGVIFPTLAATIGVRLAGALAFILATLIFSILAHDLFSERGARAAAYVFSLVCSATLVIGQLPYALAIALGLGALLAATRGRNVIAAVLAVNAALTNPLAALFVAFVGATVWFGGHPLARLRQLAGEGSHGWRSILRSAFLDGPEHGYLLVAVFALVPAVVVSALFPEGGSQPFHAGSYFGALAFTAFFWLCVRFFVSEDSRLLLASGAVLYALFLTVNELVASPVGGNAIRLGMIAFPPLAAAALWPRLGRYALLVVVPLLCWQGATAGWAIATIDETSNPNYFAPLNRYLDSRDPAREEVVEVVFTRNHFETAYVANRRPIARGWERQLDIRYNGLFYDNSLTTSSYAAWLEQKDVEWVALPDAELDYSGREEARLIERGLPYLRPAARLRDWKIFHVELPRNRRAGAVFSSDDPRDGFSVDPENWGRSLTRVRWQRFLRPSYGCIVATEDGLIELILPERASEYGQVSSEPPAVAIQPDFSLDRLVGGDAICAEDWILDERGRAVRGPTR